MPGPAEKWLNASPPDRVSAAAAELGREELALWCAAVLTGSVDLTTAADTTQPDPRWLAARGWTGWGHPSTWRDRGLDYWPRVWAARTLLHEWHPCAEPAITTGLADDHWRVREMCVKVAAKQELGSAADRCADLSARDETHRVRVAALRALGVIGEAEHAWAIKSALPSEDRAVAAAAQSARERLERRLDRPLDDLV